MVLLVWKLKEQYGMVLAERAARLECAMPLTILRTTYLFELH